MAEEREAVYLVMDGNEKIKIPDPAPSGTITYTVDEFAAAAKTLLGTTPDVVFAAFRQAGITEATKSAGIELVRDYLGRSF